MADKKRILRPPSKGDGMIWFAGSGVTVTLLMTITLLGVILVNGLGYFWPSDLVRLTLHDGSLVQGELVAREYYEKEGVEKRRTQVKVGNRDLYGLDFRWINDEDMAAQEKPAGIVVLERMEYGDFYGTIKSLEARDLQLAGENDWERFENALDAVQEKLEFKEAIEKRMSRMNREMTALRKKIIKLKYQGVKAGEANLKRLQVDNPGAFAAEGDAEGGTYAERIRQVVKKQESVRARFEEQQQQLTEFLEDLSAVKATMVDGENREMTLSLQYIVRAYRPNDMGLFAKLAFYLEKIRELLLDEPRESNTEGGLYPAIFGTVMMVFLMSLVCMPMGIIAALYLREYAKDGPVVRLVRIAVNNLAGVPSIVYGVFGLGFFVYGIGGFIDHTFFPHMVAENQQVMKTGGILWASLTLALLTVPVVIVSTEEALSSIPRGMREGSYALAATKWQTIRKVLLPMASPGILTGLILSMARAAGEVAPLMITGVVKLAPSLPLDGQYPFMHLDRKFMHLGFHIFDVGFQSPNVEAAKPMVFVTTLLLLIIVILMNMTAIRFRSRMRKRYTMGAF